jgi:hypothetical protein
VERLLAAAGGCWRLLAAAGGCWRLLAGGLHNRNNRNIPKSFGFSFDALFW